MSLFFYFAKNIYFWNNSFMKLFRNTCFLLPLILGVNALNAEALQIVYPKQPESKVTAESTFFIGNTKPNSTLTINDKVVKVYENGSFVEVVKLNDGENTIKIESKSETECDSVTYIIKKIPKSAAEIPEPETENFPPDEYIYALTVKDNAPLRAQPDENAKRLTHLSKDTVLMLNGKKGGYYRVSLTPTETAWIKAENVVNYSTINGKMLASATSISVSEDKLYDYIKTSLSFQVPYKITETENGLNFEIYNIKENTDECKTFKTSNSIKALAMSTVAQDSVSTYFLELNNKLWGYDAFYEGNNLVLKIRKAPQIDIKNPLKSITIAVDAGHGGADAGAIGPTGVKEKEINLDVAQKLKKLLEDSGANVVMTRVDDSNVDLYERPKTAKKGDSLIMLSLHANALPDGADPYKKHGTAVFYYNAESAELAKTIRDKMVSDLGTKDDGVCRSSLVLTRPTMPLSVLIEIAYMIHPDEYTLLLDENFRQNSAKSIKNALEDYLLKSVKTYTP